MLSRRGRPPKSKKNSPIIDGAKFIKRFQPKLIYDQRGLLYQDLPIGCVRTLKGGRLYQEILREKNSQYYGGAEIIKIFFRGRPRRAGMVRMLDRTDLAMYVKTMFYLLQNIRWIVHCNIFIRLQFTYLFKLLKYSMKIWFI